MKMINKVPYVIKIKQDMYIKNSLNFAKENLSLSSSPDARKNVKLILEIDMFSFWYIYIYI